MNWQPGRTLADIEKETILEAFRFFRGNKTHTANALGVSKRTIDHKLNEYLGTPLEPENEDKRTKSNTRRQ